MRTSQFLSVKLQFLASHLVALIACALSSWFFDRGGHRKRTQMVLRTLQNQRRQQDSRKWIDGTDACIMCLLACRLLFFVEFACSHRWTRYILWGCVSRVLLARLLLTEIRGAAWLEALSLHCFWNRPGLHEMLAFSTLLNQGWREFQICLFIFYFLVLNLLTTIPQLVSLAAEQIIVAS